MKTRFNLELSTIIAKDINESVRFYEETMGFTKVLEFYSEPGQGLILMQSPGGGRVELIDSDRFPAGFWSIGMEVDDMETACRELKENGAEFVYEPQDLPLGKIACITDPSGVNVVIVEYSDLYREMLKTV